MSLHSEIKTIHSISQVLLKALQQVHRISGQYLAQHSPETDQHFNKTVPNQSRPKSDKKQQKINGVDSSKPKEVAQVASQQRISKKQQKSKKQHNKIVNRDRPKQPVSAFLDFSAQNGDKIKSQCPNISQNNLVTVAGQLWKQMSDQEKRPYVQAYQRRKAVYDREIAKYLELHPEEKTKKQQKLESQQQKYK